MSAVEETRPGWLAGESLAKKIGRRRPGREFYLGPFELMLRYEPTGPYPLVDSGGSVAHLAENGCVGWTDEEYDQIEDCLYDLCEKLGMSEFEMNRFVPTCRVCNVRRGGVFDLNVRGVRVSVTLWFRPAYYVGTWLNHALVARDERSYRRREAKCREGR